MHYIIKLNVLFYSILTFQKPSKYGSKGDAENYLRRGHRCFSVRDVPEYALVSDVEVVCDDGHCFGCIQTTDNNVNTDQNSAPLTVSQMLGQGYTCVLTLSTSGPGVVCEEGKCFKCSPPEGQEYPVSLVFLDQAEDMLDDGHTCSITLQHVSRDLTTQVLCEAGLCLHCWRGPGQVSGDMRLITERTVERAEHLAKRGYTCNVVTDGQVSSHAVLSEETVCDGELCFVCRA